MKIKSEKDLHISTTWGAAIFLKGGEEREVGDDMGYQALQQGAVEVKEAPAEPAPKKRGRPKKTTKKTVRARNEDGHYVADDPSTPDVNEAYVEVEDTKVE